MQALAIETAGNDGSTERLPQQLGVIVASCGTYTQVVFSNRGASARREPLQLQLSGVQAGCAVEVLNRSADPSASWGKNARRVKLLDEACAVMLGESDMRSLEVLPGDVLEVRQIDAAGNASLPTRVTLAAAPLSERFATKDAYGSKDVKNSKRTRALLGDAPRPKLHKQAAGG
jgi:hypothetical protein